jgi:hypothetical protein
LQFDFAERVRVQLVAIPRGAQCSAWLLVFVPIDLDRREPINSMHLRTIAPSLIP